jgi:hypothetical protein
MICFDMHDESFLRLLDYDHRRYWLNNGWSIRFRIAEVQASAERPHGIKYSFTMHDVDRTRLLGFDNAHGVPRQQHFLSKRPRMQCAGKPKRLEKRQQFDAVRSMRTGWGRVVVPPGKTRRS